jgi:hypothetical protein
MSKSRVIRILLAGGIDIQAVVSLARPRGGYPDMMEEFARLNLGSSAFGAGYRILAKYLNLPAEYQTLNNFPAVAILRIECAPCRWQATPIFQRVACRWDKS